LSEREERAAEESCRRRRNGETDFLDFSHEVEVDFSVSWLYARLYL
jgi:hypothetical protein